MVKYEHTYEATPAMIAVPFSKSLSSPASISMLRMTQQVKISTASSLDPTIEEIESIISESPTDDVTEEDIIREGTHEDDDEESRESAPPDDAEEKDDEQEKEEKEEEEQHENKNETDASEAPASPEFVPDRVDGHTYHEAAMLGLNGTPTAAPNNANKKNKKKNEGTSSLASELSHSWRGSMKGLKREDSMNKEIKKPTSQAAARAADDNRTTAAASSAPPANNTTVASAPEEEEKDFVPHRADGHTYFEAAMLGLNGTPPTAAATTTGKKKKKARKMPSFFRKKK